MNVHRTPGTAAFQPAVVTSVDERRGPIVPEIRAALAAGEKQRAFVVVFRDGVPLGTAYVTSQELASETEASFSRRLPKTDDGQPACRPLGTDSSSDATRSRLPAVSVIVCSRNRVRGLLALLRSLERVDYPDFEVVVVDNAPPNDDTRRAVAEFRSKMRPRYVLEPVPGQTRARNAGVAAARHDVLAFADDDTVVEASWLHGLARGFAEGEDVGAVSGLTFPAELETEAQQLFEDLGGHRKGRGFTRVIFDPSSPDAQHPMYPLPQFGVGCNMAFRRRALEQVGGFDVALGPGTRLPGGDDTLAFTEVMLAGWRVVYEPTSIIWHFHRRSMDQLIAQRRGYGVALGAYYAALLAREPGRLWQLVKLVPRALSDLRANPWSSGSSRQSTRASTIYRPGLALGPILYAYTRVNNSVFPAARPVPASGPLRPRSGP
jgi:GT2 family glycosyltransferase